MVTSLQAGVPESSDFDSKLAVFRAEEKYASFSQVVTMVAKQRSIAIAEIAMIPFWILTG